MTILLIETIKTEAEQAAEAGQAPDVCRYPVDSYEGRRWRRFYAAADGQYRHALAAYRAAIGAESA